MKGRWFYVPGAEAVFSTSVLILNPPFGTRERSLIINFGSDTRRGTRIESDSRSIHYGTVRLTGRQFQLVFRSHLTCSAVAR